VASSPSARVPCPPGVVVVDKPRGPTSHDVVAILRRALGTREIGHAGTLDPMATGVLVVAVGEATKLVPWLTADDKAYEATVRLGVTTDSLDADGVVTASAPISDELRSALAEGTPSPLLARAVATELARTAQVPPAVSALRVGGERAHAIARRGEVPDLPPREVAVRRLEITGAGLEPEPWLGVRVEVAKGYYVRALARDLAAGLGTVGHLVSLRRTRSGAFTLADAAPLDAASDGEREADRALHRERQGARLRAALVPLATAASRALPVSVLDADGVRAARFGQPVALAHLRDPHAAPSAWLDEGGGLVAIGQAAEGGPGKVLRGFSP